MRLIAAMLMVFAMVLSGSGVAAAPAALQDSTPDAFQDVDSGSENVPPELCPPDGAPVDEAVLVAEADGGIYLLPYVNDQSEIFLITVSGVNDEAKRLYVDEARFCFDPIFTGTGLEPEGRETEEPDEEIVEEDLVDADVVVDFEFVGLFPEADAAVVREMVAEFFASGESPSDLPLWLGDEFLDAAELEERGEAWVIDFYIDPSISLNWRHFYSAVTTSVTVKVYSYGGAVTARLFRYSSPTYYLKDSASLPVGRYDTLSASSTSQRTYQLCIEGDKSANQYALAGRWTKSVSSGAPKDATSSLCPAGVR